MPFKLNIFRKIVGLLVLLLIPILLLYAYTNRITNRVVQEQIQGSNLNQLSFFLHQLDADIKLLSMFPVILGSDPYIRDYMEGGYASSSDRLKAKSRILEKLSLQSVSSGWSNDLTIVLPGRGEVLSSSIFLNGMTAWPWRDPIRSVWTYDKPHSAGGQGSFIREVGEPFRAKTVSEAAALFQVRFSNENIVHLLDVYKQDRKSDPFLYNAAFDPILNSTVNGSIAESIISQFHSKTLPVSGQQLLDIDKQKYLISYVGSEQLSGWILFDYVPVERILSPITTTRKLFYVSIGLLLMLSVLASFLLYRNVQIPLGKMIRGMQLMKGGDLSTRIDYRAKNEFDYLIRRFNEMAEQIQGLIENVFAERIRFREATLKQLQSQIHPHFLYNSLFFIINSAELDDKESVVAMAQNLAEFYRYTTRVENQSVTLKDELELVGHYLNIQHLRIHRLQYEIEVPSSMLQERVPRLIVQPLVENAIVHGIEKTLEGNRIWITGEQDEAFNRIVVEDNGRGMSCDQIVHLQRQLQDEMTDEIGCGTWNVHHRLEYQFGAGSGLHFEKGSQGGLRAILTWSRERRLAPAQREGNRT